MRVHLLEPPPTPTPTYFLNTQKNALGVKMDSLCCFAPSGGRNWVQVRENEWREIKYSGLEGVKVIERVVARNNPENKGMRNEG